MEKGYQSRSSGSLCTRSRAAPVWTLQELLTLVNEINAIENDFCDTLPSFQKWQLVVENCNALEVKRNLNQCRGKWNSLIYEYNKIMKWESESDPAVSYWSIEGDKKKEFGLPECFHSELFEAIDNYMKTQKGKMGTDVDAGPEAEGIRLEIIAKTGTKKRRRSKMMPMRHDIEERVKPQRHNICEKIKNLGSEERVELARCKVHERTMQDESEIEEKEQMMAEKLHGNVEEINAILEGNLVEHMDYKLADMNNVEIQTDFIRSQGDNLITCLANLADTLNELCDLVQ